MTHVGEKSYARAYFDAKTDAGREKRIAWMNWWAQSGSLLGSLSGAEIHGNGNITNYKKIWQFFSARFFSAFM